MLHIYKHLGYYNDVEDIKALAGKSAVEVIKYNELNLGHFYESEGDSDADLVLEDEIKGKRLSLTPDKKFLVSNDTIGWDDWNKENKETGDSDAYIDIYVLYKVNISGDDFINEDFI